MGDDVKKIYDELSSLGRVNVPYDQFAQAYTSRADYKEKIDLAYGEIFPELKKKDDSQSGSPLLSGVSSSEFQPGGTIDINGEEVSYDDFLKRFVKGEEVYGSPIEAEEVVVTPAPSTAENLWNSTKIGLLNLQEAVYNIPRTLYQIAAIPQNIIADQAQIPELRANYDEFLNMIPDRVGATQNPLALVDDIAKVTSADIEALAAKKAQDGATITELYNTKGFGAAAERTAEYVLESLPISIAAIASGGVAGGAGGFSMVASGVTAGTLSFPLHKKELEKYDLQDWESDGLALILSGLEAAFEGPANKVIASQTAKILLESGEDAAKNFARDASFAIFNRALVPFATTAASGSASEMATTYSQNVVKKLTVNPELNVFEGVADAGIVGFVSDPLITSVPLSVQMIGNTSQHLKNRRERKRAIQEIEVALEDETLPAEVIDNLKRSRDVLIEGYNADGMRVNEMYERMSDEDKSTITDLSKKLLGLANSLGRKKLTDTQKQAIESTFTELSMQKADIESKYEKPVGDDSENQVGVEFPTQESPEDILEYIRSQATLEDDMIDSATTFLADNIRLYSDLEFLTGFLPNYGKIAKGLMPNNQQILTIKDPSLLTDEQSAEMDDIDNQINEELKKVPGILESRDNLSAQKALRNLSNLKSRIDSIVKSNIKNYEESSADLYKVDIYKYGMSDEDAKNYTSLNKSLNEINRYSKAESLKKIIKRLESFKRASENYAREGLDYFQGGKKMTPEAFQEIIDKVEAELSSLGSVIEPSSESALDAELRIKKQISDILSKYKDDSSGKGVTSSSAGQEPTWLGKPVNEVIDQRLPEELTEQELMDLAKQVYGDVFIEPGQLQDIQKVYSLGRKVAKGDMNFTDEEVNLYGEYGDVIDQISNSIKNQMTTENNRARTRQQANAIANKALKGDEFTEEDNAFYAENQEEVEAAMYEARAAQGRAASQMPEIVRQEQKKRAPKKVTMTDKSLVRQRIQDMIEGARGAVNEVAALQESIKEMINELTTAGAITAKQAAALVKAALDVRVNRPSSAKRFADKYEAIMKGAALEVQKNKAKDLRTKLGKIGKQRFTPFNIKDVITEFLRVNPESVDDIGVYNEMAEALMAVARSRKIDKASIERVLPYIDGQDSLARALGRKPLKSYAQEARLRGYMNEVIMQYVQDQFEQARDERMDKIAEETGVSREELEETLRDMSEDEILSGYYDTAGNNITMEDGSRRTVERDIVERMKASLGKAGIDTANMSDREIQDLFARTQEQKKGSRNEKYQSLINAKLAIINTEGLSPTLSSARYRDVSGLSARELSALNSMLDNIINNGSQANAGNAKILLEKTGRVEQIKEILERKKLSNFTEKLLGIVGSKEWNKRPVFFRFDQIIEQIAGRGDIGSLLDELGYDNYRVSEAAADVILVNSRKFINDVTARLNKKYGTDVNSAQNQARATILQLFVQARNNMTKANESLIVNSIIENLKATSRAYAEGDAVDVQIATTIDEFLTQLGTPSYVDNVVGFAMLDNVEAKAKLFAGPAMIEYVDAWKGVHEQHVELYADYLEKYRNEQLKREDNYTAISIRKQGSTRNVMDEFDPASQDAAEINVFSKINSQFNKLIAAPKSKNFIERNPSYQLADGDFYNMKFASVQDRSLNASVRESIIGPAVREVASMTASSGAMKLFNTSSLDNTNSEALTFTLSNEIGAEYAYRSFDSPVIQTLKNVASPAIFGSVFEQFFKQSLPALLSTHVRVSMYNPRAFSATGRAMAYLASASTNKKAKDVITQIMNRSDVQQRDLIATVIDPIAQLSVIGSRINSGNTASKIFGAVKDGSEQARNLAMMPLRQGDRLAAQASFLAFLDEAYLSKYGKRFTYEQMLAAYDPELFAKASFELRSAQNVNSGKAMAQALRPGDNNASFIQSTLLSWASFAVNFKTGIYNDVANIADSKDSDSRKMAMASLTARVTEAVSYSAMLVYGLPILYSALASTLFGDDDEYTQGLDEFLQSEEKFKRFYSRIVTEVLPLTSNVPGFAPMSMLLGDIVLEGVNDLYYNISPNKQEQGLTKKEAERIGLLPFKTYPTEAQDLLGKYTTSVQLAADSKEALSAATTGKYTDENGNTYYYDQAQRKKLFKIGSVMGLASAGLSISEIKNAANASMRSVRAGKYKNEFERYIQSDFTEDMPTDWMSDADRTTLELMKSGAALPAEISSAIIGEPFKYSELYSKMQSVSPRAAGILLYNRLKDEPKSSQDSIVGEIAYRASTEDKNALKIFEEYMFEKNRVEKLGFSKEDIVEMAAGMQDKLDNTKQVLENIDEKKVNKRLNELSDFLNTNLDKQ